MPKRNVPLAVVQVALSASLALIAAPGSALETRGSDRSGKGQGAGGLEPASSGAPHTAFMNDERFTTDVGGVPRTLRTQNSNKAWSLWRFADNPNHFRFEARHNDFWKKTDGSYDDTPNNRSQVYSEEPLQFDTDYWFSFATKLVSDPSVSYMKSTFYAFFGLHGTEDPGDAGTPGYLGFNAASAGAKSGPMSWVFEPRYNDNAIATDSNYKSHGNILAVPIVRNRWYHWVFHVKFQRTPTSGTNGNQGALEIWVDGVQRYSNLNIRIGFNDQLGPYPKLGPYKGANSADTVIVETANWEWSTSSLASRITNPLPL